MTEKRFKRGQIVTLKNRADGQPGLDAVIVRADGDGWWIIRFADVSIGEFSVRQDDLEGGEE